MRRPGGRDIRNDHDATIATRDDCREARDGRLTPPAIRGRYAITSSIVQVPAFREENQDGCSDFR